MPEPSRASRRRDEILAAAVDLASAEGLSALTIGSLARTVEMSKSGLFAHFGSKEELQLATIARAGSDFERGVLRRADGADPGLPRLRALTAAWFDYVEGIDYRGGCFFDTASREFGSQPGEVRDLLARLCSDWRNQLEEQARLAVRLGELSPDADPELLAFQLHAYAGEANWACELLRDREAFERARLAARGTLESAAAGASSSPGGAGSQP
jgi:AcrR family transcriptional regulator